VRTHEGNIKVAELATPSPSAGVKLNEKVPERIKVNNISDQAASRILNEIDWK
jgi:hypothetical protein